MCKQKKGARNPLDYVSVIKNNKELLKSLFEETQKVGSKPLTMADFGDMNSPMETSKQSQLLITAAEYKYIIFK